MFGIFRKHTKKDSQQIKLTLLMSKLFQTNGVLRQRANSITNQVELCEMLKRTEGGVDFKIESLKLRIAEEIAEYLMKTGIAPGQLSAALGLQRRGVIMLLRTELEIGVDTLFRIADAIGKELVIDFTNIKDVE